jgi:hypothetical protein
MSHGVEDLNSIWITEFVAQETGSATMNGFAVSRARIPRIAALFPNAQLKEVTTEEIRDERVYRYKIEVPSIINLNK